jgi:outer membrane PBP1 activator LpoA protein
MKYPVLILAVLLLSACATRGPHNGPYAPSSGSLYERQVIAALANMRATDEQRAKVLGAYDQLAPVLKNSDQQSTTVRKQWQALDPRDASYMVQSDKLAQESAAATSQRLSALAQFNHTVATTLDEAQWQRWSEQMNADYAAYDAPPGSGGGGGGRRGRR